MEYLKKSLLVLLLLTVLVISPKQAKAAEVALTEENLTKSDIKRFLSGDFIREKMDETRFQYVASDRHLKKRPIKTLVISRKLCSKDRRWIEKQVKKRGIKLIVE